MKSMEMHRWALGMKNHLYNRLDTKSEEFHNSFHKPIFRE